MGTASVQKAGLHLAPVLSIPMSFAAPVHRLLARISAVGLKRCSLLPLGIERSESLLWKHFGCPVFPSVVPLCSILYTLVILSQSMTLRKSRVIHDSENYPSP